MDCTKLYYILDNITSKEDKYVRKMCDSLGIYFPDVEFVDQMYEKSFFEICSIILAQENSKRAGTVAFISGTLVGPLFPIDDAINAFLHSSSSVMADYVVDEENYIDISKAHFLITKPEAILESKMDPQQVHFMLKDKNYKFLSRSDLYDVYNIVESGTYPFLNIEAFSLDDYIKHTMGDGLNKLMEYISESAYYDVDCIWEAILKRYNINDIKTALHLNYILNDNIKKKNNHKCAVFAHLYYEDLFDVYLNRLKEVPDDIDIYLSTTEERIQTLSKKASRLNVNVKKIVVAGERGRDAGALLVAFRKYIGEYEYICFLHDKKTSGGLEDVRVGEAFCSLIWDTLLGSKETINQIIGLLEEKPRLGFLSPMMPIVGGYINGLLGFQWTICYEETCKLAKRLGLELKIDEKKSCFALSTTFWCKTESLRPIFEYEWKFEDFPAEPLELDGTINHAIERALIYIAQSQGFYSATVVNDEYAQLYLNNMQFILDSVFASLHNSFYFPTVKFPLDVDEMISDWISLKCFCQNCEKLYLYGAGTWAQIIYEKMEKINKRIDGVVVSSIGSFTTFNNLNVEEYETIKTYLKSENIGIIVAMSHKFSREVEKILQRDEQKYYVINTED